jgi:hypothetical protein
MENNNWMKYLLEKFALYFLSNQAIVKGQFSIYFFWEVSFSASSCAPKSAKKIK